MQIISLQFLLFHYVCSGSKRPAECYGKQDDILISKNQVLQMLYLKHHVCKALLIIMDKKLTKYMKI